MTASTFQSLIDELQTDPVRHLDTVSVLSLGAFFSGYRMVDKSAERPLDLLRDRLEGPSGLSAFIRAHLQLGDGPQVVSSVLAMLAEVVAEHPCGPPAPGALASTAFIDYIRGPISSGRCGMVIGEPTVVSLRNHFAGHLAGLDAVAPEFAAAERSRLAAFEAWLRADYHKAPQRASWYAVLRVVGGPCERGVRMFVELWDEFERAHPHAVRPTRS